MKKNKRYLIIFAAGSAGYGFIEILWRGRTHWSMLIAGGLCFVVFSVIEKHLKNTRLLYKCILGSISVTLVELVFGLVFNVLLGQKVWDYSRMPLNLAGQICLPFSVLWGILGALFIPLAGKLDVYLENKKTVAR